MHIVCCVTHTVASSTGSLIKLDAEAKGSTVPEDIYKIRGR